MKARPRACSVWSITFAAVVALSVGAILMPAPPARADEDPRLRAYEQQFERMQREMEDLRNRVRVLEQERGRGPAAVTAAPPVTTAPPAPGTAAAPPAEQDRKIDVLAKEVENLKSRIVLPESKQLKSIYGLGPAASKVYQVDRGLSIGGYGEFLFQKFVEDQHGNRDQFDLLRFVLYTGYKFSDRIILNTEIEFEHALIGEETASAESGAVEVEFLSLDFLAWKPLNFRAGLLLVPMGFLNEIHEPPFFHGVFRPEVEQNIIPTTWREGGVGIFGTLAEGLEYRAYVMNGLNAKGFESENIREARQVGNRALAEDLAGTVRLDYSPIPGTLLGASFWAGGSGQDETYAGRKPDVFTLIWETHAQVRYRGLELRALGAFTNIDDADLVSEELGETIGEDQFGFYAEAAYDLLPLLAPDTTQYLAPFFRYEIFDTQDGVPEGFARIPGHSVQLYTVGASYKPHPQVVLKLEYRNFDAHGQQPDDVNVGAGFVF